MSVSSSVLNWQPQPASLIAPPPPAISMLDHNCCRELYCLVNVFRRVGKMGGKASLTTSTEDGHWRASLDIQMNLPTAAHPGQAQMELQYDDAMVPSRLFVLRHVLGLTRRPWLLDATPMSGSGYPSPGSWDSYRNGASPTTTL